MSSFGESLRRERELREISLREISEATKINIRYLESLENNDFRHLPGGVFNKGFVRAYAQFVGIDPESTINSYLLEAQTQSAPDGGHDPGMLRNPTGGVPKPPVPADAGRSVSPAIIVGAVVVVAALIVGVVLLWPSDEPVAPDPAPTVSEPVGTGSSDVLSEDPPEAAAPDPIEVVRNEPEIVETEQAPPVVVEPAAPQPETHAIIGGVAVVELARATTGRLNCDNRRIEILAGMPPGTRLDFTCEAFLIVDAEDAGAVYAGTPDGPLTPVGPDGESIRGRVIPLHASRPR